MTLAPGILLMAIGATLPSPSPAGPGMFLGGFFLCLAALALLGPSSYSLNRATGKVVITRRYCVVRAPPRARVCTCASVLHVTPCVMRAWLVCECVTLHGRLQNVCPRDSCAHPTGAAPLPHV